MQQRHIPLSMNQNMYQSFDNGSVETLSDLDWKFEPQNET